MNILKLKDEDAQYGTSFFGDAILASTDALTEKFGDCDSYNPSDYSDKVTREWALQLDDDTPFCIYDWKEYRLYGDDIEVNFHIGARNKKDSERVFKVLTEEYGLKKGQW